MVDVSHSMSVLTWAKESECEYWWISCLRYTEETNDRHLVYISICRCCCLWRRGHVTFRRPSNSGWLTHWSSESRGCRPPENLYLTSTTSPFWISRRRPRYSKPLSRRTAVITTSARAIWSPSPISIFLLVIHSFIHSFTSVPSCSILTDWLLSLNQSHCYDKLYVCLILIHFMHRVKCHYFRYHQSSANLSIIQTLDSSFRI